MPSRDRHFDTHVEMPVMEAAPQTSPVWSQAKLVGRFNHAPDAVESARPCLCRSCLTQQGAKNVTERGKAVVYACQIRCLLRGALPEPR